jgi:hypothetical protein
MLAGCEEVLKPSAASGASPPKRPSSLGDEDVGSAIVGVSILARSNGETPGSTVGG